MPRIANNLITDDHAYTYLSNKLIHIGHRKRLKETINFLDKNINYRLSSIMDIGGGSGFIGDKIAEKFKNISSQRVYDIIHPENEKNSFRRWYKPKLPTKYNTFNINSDNLISKNIKQNTLIICSETIEHVGDPIISSKMLLDTIKDSSAELYISYPIETGLIGFLKFAIKCIIVRYKKKRTIKSLIFQFLWLIGIKKVFREKNDLYHDHDGFNDKLLTKFILKNFKNKLIKYKLFLGLSSVHIYCKVN